MDPYYPGIPTSFLRKLFRSNALLNSVCSVYHCTFLNLECDEAIAAGGKSFTAFAHRPNDSLPVWARQFQMKTRIEMRDMTMMNLLHNYVVNELEALALDPASAVVRMNGFDRDAWKAAMEAMPSTPDLIIAGEDAYKAHVGSLTADQRYSDKSTRERGFENCMFERVPVVLETTAVGMPSDAAYLISSRQLVFWTGHLSATKEATVCPLNWVGALSVLPSIE